MVKRFNASLYRSRLNQIRSKQRQALGRLRRALHELQSAVDRYNREVRSYDARRHSHLQRLAGELSRVQARSGTTHSQFRSSVTSLHATYSRLEQVAASRPRTTSENFFLDLSEREAANSLGVLNALEESGESFPSDQELEETIIEDEVAVISEELDGRWRGALFALNPRNPEAARHFCTSSREIFVEILDLKAPDAAVFEADPGCARTERGNATRRSKMSFLLARKGISLPELAEFASDDIGNVLELFEVLNSATHGASGRLDLSALRAIKRRVEDGLLFLSRLAA